MSTNRSLSMLLDFAIEHHLVLPEDREYTLNRLLEIMQMDAPADADDTKEELPPTATPILEALLEEAVQRGLCQDSAEQRDLFATKLMGAVTPHPQLVRERFAMLSDTLGVQAATDDFYAMCKACDYIKVDRIAKNMRFFHDTPVGELEITINLSKPEKDPRDIAAQRNAVQKDYPKCMLCVENPGYAGRAGFPARQNHRMIPITLGGEKWYLQYSPYAYYDEHCIVLNSQHVPMKVSRSSFIKLLDFVEQFPHYMLGSNADLPIVGGSILSHDHFQGGGYTFPMEKAKVRIPLAAPDAEVSAYVADWPMTCIVLESANREKLTDLADQMLTAWRGYSDPDCDILAETDGTPHNTITPVARKAGDKYRLYLVLRNNRTTDEHPLGIFHPHADLHHIKKENIGLIEVMGLFILPGRLVQELAVLRNYLTGDIPLTCAPAEDSPLLKHYPWIQQLCAAHGTSLTEEAAEEVLRAGLADKCARVLMDAGVYKQNEQGDKGILRFLAQLNYQQISK